MTFLGINDKNIFKIDPRVNPKQAAVETKTYATNNGFTHISTNAQGNFAIGNDLGEVRLFTKIGQKAKNNYPGLGDPIIGIDSSKDGKWVLATCKNYIMLIPTFYENQNGFTHSIKNINKATPRILRIHPKDLKKLNIKDVCFGKAVFDDSEKNKEEFIVVSTGDFLFIWNLKQILQGKIFDYEVIKKKKN